MGAFAPTEQQMKIIQAAQRRDSFVVEAGAGAGKTSTLRLIADNIRSTYGMRPRLQYMAYNKAIVEDTRSSMSEYGVQCSTAHSLAYRGIGLPPQGLRGAHFQDMLRPGAGALQGWQIAKAIGVRRWQSADRKFKVSGPTVASLARRTVKKFAGTTSPTIEAWHMPTPDSMSNADCLDELRAHVLPYAHKIWNIARHPGQHLLRFDHDWYVRLWWEQGPTLPADMLLFDECQDADPLLRDVFDHQNHAVRIAVGDSQQSIYAWRGAENALTHFREQGAPMYPLTTSWRFGQTIADEANRWLDMLDAEIRLDGNPAITSEIAPIDESKPWMQLCRTNAGVISTLVEMQQRGLKVAMVGCDKEVKALATALGKLHAGQDTDHPALIGFENWDDLALFAGSDDCDDPTLRTLVRLADRDGVEVVSAAVNSCVEESDAHVRATTAHKAKGREADQVNIHGDFAASNGRKSDDQSGGMAKADLRLNYVTVTRARRRLGGLENLTMDMPGTAVQEGVQNYLAERDPRYDESHTALF